MRKLIVPKGLHICVNQLPYITNTKEMSADIVFDSSCIYSIGTDQKDWNKMPIGFSIGLFPVGITKPMHVQSIRFGWRWNNLTSKIEVSPYWYDNFERHYAETDGLDVGQLDINQRYTFSIKFDGNIYVLSIFSAAKCEGIWKIDLPRTANYGWTANLYFGGNISAPHKVTMDYKRLS